MALEGYVSNRPDLDLVSSNIKDGVTIFGVEGDFSGGIGTLGVGQSQLLGSGVGFRTMPQYIVEISYLYSLDEGLHAYVQYGDKLYIGIGSIYPAGNYDTHFLEINLITGAIISLGSAHQLGSLASFSGMNIDNNILYWNCEYAYNNIYRHYELDLTTGIFTGPIGGVYHTGTTPQNTPITIGGKTFTISPIIPSGGGLTADLQHGNSANGTIHWTGILVS